MLSFFKTLAIILVVAIIAFVVYRLPMNTEPPRQPDPPCEELVWMRDSPQARCVEYWKQRNIEEQKNEPVYE